MNAKVVKKYEVAGHRFSIEADGDSFLWSRMEEAYAPFEQKNDCEGQVSSVLAPLFSVRVCEWVDFGGGEMLYSDEGNGEAGFMSLNVSKSESGYLFLMTPPGSKEVNARLFVDSGFSFAELSLHGSRVHQWFAFTAAVNFCFLLATMTSGVGLRQVCDWAMYLHRYHQEIDVQVLERDLRSFRLKKVWLLFSDIAVHYLGLPKEECPLYDGRRKKASAAALQYIFSEGNFGHYSDRKRTPRPKGYTAGKFHTFHNRTAKYSMLLRLFPMQTFRFYTYFMLLGVYHYMKGLWRKFVNA